MTDSYVAAPRALAAWQQANPPSRSRTPRTRRYAMTPPAFFAVEYAINPWMDVTTPVDVARRAGAVGAPAPDLPSAGPHRRPDRARARAAGHGLCRQRRIHRERHRVVARFRFAERAGESRAYAGWMSSVGYRAGVHSSRQRGTGRPSAGRRNGVGGLRLSHRPTRARRDRRGAGDAGGLSRTGGPSLLSPRHRAGRSRRPHDRVLPAGVQRGSAATNCTRCSPTPSWLGSADAYVLGLNAVSDGLHVVLSFCRNGFRRQLRDAGFEPVGVDLSELLKGGGSVKCCTLEVYP